MSESKDTKERSLECTCVQDGFGALPPELRPQPKKKGNLRRVTCPGCGLVYRTNRETDLCMKCEREQRRGS